MALTSVTVTGQFDVEPSTPIAGSLTWSLSSPMFNSTSSLTVPNVPITVTITNSGTMSVALFANDDSTTEPTGTAWTVLGTFGTGSSAKTFGPYTYIISHTNAPSVDISALTPVSSPSNIVFTNGVISLNSLNGDITLAAGTNITLTPSGNTITIASSGGSGSGVTSLNGLTGGLSIAATGLTVTPSGTTVTISGAAPLASPTFTGTPAAPTATSGTNTTQLATTAFVQTAVTGLAPLSSPTFTGTPAAPTASSTTNTTQIATTAFVQTGLTNLLASPAFTGTPTAPTATGGTNTTQIATTAFVQSALGGAGWVAGAATTISANSYSISTISSTANYYDVTVAHSYNTALTLRAPSSLTDRLVLNIKQDGTGGNVWSITNVGSGIWASGNTPSPTTSANAADLVIGYPTYDGTGWVLFTTAEIVTGYLPIQEATTALGTTGTITLTLPTTGGTVQTIAQSGNITLANPSTTPASGFAVSLTLRLVTDSSHTTTFPTTNTRWGGQSSAGSAPTLAASATYDFIIKNLDQTHWDWTYERFA